jgi:plasmid stabilization system protein ParE
MQVIYSDAARRDLAEAVAWFEEHAPLGGAGFAALLRETVEKIAEVPLAAPCWGPEPRFRAWTLQRVNYRVFYEIVGKTIRVVAIAHTSRRPGYWRDRPR